MPHAQLVSKPTGIRVKQVLNGGTDSVLCSNETCEVGVQCWRVSQSLVTVHRQLNTLRTSPTKLFLLEHIMIGLRSAYGEML